MVLNKFEIKELIEEEGLIEDFPHLSTQLQPNGFDFTVDEIYEFSDSGCLDFSNSEREFPDGERIDPVKKDEGDDYGWWSLSPGSYKVKSNELIDLPNDLCAVSFPRSSLLRMGCFTQHGVWDAGFRGKSEFILVVNNPEGVEIKENARLNQLVFMNVDETESYEGIHKGLE